MASCRCWGVEGVPSVSTGIASCVLVPRAWGSPGIVVVQIDTPRTLAAIRDTVVQAATLGRPAPAAPA